MIDNERRADLGADAIYAAGKQTGVARQEAVSTVIADVLAYAAHFCDRVGLDPGSMFDAGIESYRGDFEDGSAARRVGDGQTMGWDELDASRRDVDDEQEVCGECEALYPRNAVSVEGSWHAESCSAHTEDRVEEARDYLCTIAFQAEAHDTAIRYYHQLAARLIVTVIPVGGPRFDAELLDVTVGEDGQYKARFARWSDELGGGNHDDTVVLDIYDEIERVEVF